MKCTRCKATAVVSLPSHTAGFCESCFLEFFRRQVERGIQGQKLFAPEERILVALSGGKDSLALMLILHELEYDVTGLHIDLSIPGSSVVSRDATEAFCAKHNLRLIVREMAAEGLPLPKVKERLRRPICSVCGKIKRHYFNKVALEGGFDALATGHNLDDEVARLFSNTLRWDGAYLSDQGPRLEGENGFARKVKPLWRLTEFEVANYAFLRGIENHYAPCPYSKGASFTLYKHMWHDLEAAMPGRKLDFYQGFLERGRPAFAAREAEQGLELSPCSLCGSPSSHDVCGVCRIKQAVAEHEQEKNDNNL
jgi:Predicted ATPase of the PP-loop superfamily implicated in cell cycle control